MESVINNKYLQSYAEKFTNIVCNDFFNDKEVITGQEILGLTELKQVNLFIIKKLMDQWAIEAEKLKSPYFNYENEEVKSSLNELLNILSKNILIDEKHFTPLLREAITDTLYLIFSPFEFFHRELGSTKTSHLKSDLFNKKKFIKINNELYDAFLEKTEAVDQEKFSAEEARKHFNRVCEEINFEPKDPDPFIDKLSAVEPLYIQKIYNEIETGSSDQEDIRVKNEPKKESGDKKVLYERFQNSGSTLADELKNESSDTVLNYHQRQKIESIRKNISIHQKFLIVKELFQNNDEEFNQVIDYLDGCSDRNEALEYLRNNYFDTNIWTEDMEAVTELMTVIDKKFI